MDNKLKEIRNSRGLSAMDLASKIGVHLNTIYSWENGGDIPSSYLVMLANTLECSVNDILGLN